MVGEETHEQIIPVIFFLSMAKLQHQKIVEWTLEQITNNTFIMLLLLLVLVSAPARSC